MQRSLSSRRMGKQEQVCHQKARVYEIRIKIFGDRAVKYERAAISAQDGAFQFELQGEVLSRIHFFLKICRKVLLGNAITPFCARLLITHVLHFLKLVFVLIRLLTIFFLKMLMLRFPLFIFGDSRTSFPRLGGTRVSFSPLHLCGNWEGNVYDSVQVAQRVATPSRVTFSATVHGSCTCSKILHSITRTRLTQQIVHFSNFPFFLVTSGIFR